MPDKPRVKAPKQRTAPPPGSRGRSGLVAGVAALAALAVVGLVAVLVSLGGGGRPSEDEVRASLEAAGCTLEAKPALPGEHSITDPAGSSPQWNTDPPTSGPHYAQAAIFGIYEEPLELARVVHNLEHGGIYILWGERVPPATVDALRAFYAEHKPGTIMAPLPRLGDEFALGAWVVDGDTRKGYLAECKAFDEDAVSSFFRAFQFRGPERFDPSALQPGS
jgi:hypothetical protein